GIGMVLMVAFLGATWVEYYFRANIRNENIVKRPLALTWATAAAIFGVLLNPRGPQMWLHPFNIFGQLEENKMTTELYSYKEAAYWAKEAYINIAFLLIVVAVIAITGFFAKSDKKKGVEKTKKSAVKKTDIPKEPRPLL